MKDEDYRAAIRALEAGEIDPGGELGRLGAEAMQRLQAAGLPWVFDRCADVFVEYHTRVMDSPDSIKAERRIQKAMRALADLLDASGLSSSYVIEDAEVWARIGDNLDENTVSKMVQRGAWPPNNGYLTPLELYLRAAADWITEREEEVLPAFDRYLGEVMPPDNGSSRLKPFVARRMSEQVRFIGDHLAQLERDGYAPDVPAQFRPRPCHDRDPDDTRSPPGHNKIAAALTSIILAEDVRDGYISQVNRGTSRRGKNL
ncbi:MAG: hypothetical protein HUJ28_09340 [Chromatiales bacterium]|nr:hypothetical protein [Chromatiales bacterium]